MKYAELEAENTVMRGILANSPGIPCVYCGVDNISKCPRGFPGCAQADDMMIAWDESEERLGKQLWRARGVVRDLWGLLKGGGTPNDDMTERVERELNQE